VAYPQVRYPAAAVPTGFTGLPKVVGSTFDPVTRTLFLMITTKTWPASEQTIFAYKVR
jgi:hypothetical protein